MYKKKIYFDHTAHSHTADPVCLYCHSVNTCLLTSILFLTTSHLQKVFKVWLIVDASLKQCGSVDLTGTEADVRLHVGKLRCKDISYHLHRRVLSSCLLTNTQRPAHNSTNRSEDWAHFAAALKTAVHDLLIMRKTACTRPPSLDHTYFTSLVLQASNSLQFTKIIAISKSFSRPDSVIGLWKTCTNTQKDRNVAQ